MRKAQVVIAITFLAIFGAGAVTALVGTRFRADHPHDDKRPPSFLRDQLQLTPTQEEQMREIWQKTREQMGNRGDQRRELSKQRDAEVRALLSDDLKKKYDDILAKYEAKSNELREAADAAMKQAENHTREILTPEQRVKYEEILKRPRPDDRGRGSSRPSGPQTSPPPGH